MMAFLKGIIRCFFVLLLLAIATVAIDFCLFEVSILIDGTLFMLVWYVSLFVVPWVAQVFILSFFTQNKMLVTIISVIGTLVMQVLVYSFCAMFLVDTF